MRNLTRQEPKEFDRGSAIRHVCTLTGNPNRSLCDHRFCIAGQGHSGFHVWRSWSTPITSYPETLRDFRYLLVQYPDKYWDARIVTIVLLRDK